MTKKWPEPPSNCSEQLHLLKAALEAAANAIVITDRVGRIEWTNAAFSTLTGYTAQEVIGKTSRFLASGKHPREFYSQMWRTILSQKVWSGEVINKRKDGSLYTEEMTITPVQANGGEWSHFIAVKQDVTDRKSLEQQFRQAQKMEAVGRLAGGIAHDFNNLLNVISGYCEILDSQIGDETTLGSITQEIRRAVGSAAGLTTQLLAFSRKQVFEPRVISPNNVVLDTVKLLKAILGENVELRLNLSRDPGNVVADPAQLQQVIMNLGVNARDAMPNGGRLTISTQNVVTDAGETKSGSLAPGRYVRLCVKDTGIGMDNSTLQRAFEPFFTTKPQGQGTGLGLSTVYGIIKQSGGYIYLSSTPGAGTSADIYLAKVDMRAKVCVNQQPPCKNEHGNEKILLVEDYAALRDIMERTLRTKGYSVITAKDAVQALDVAESQDEKIDVLVTDVIMPGMDGFELANRLLRRFSNLKIVYISGHANERLGATGLTKRNLIFLKKPFELSSLLAKVRQALEPVNRPNNSRSAAGCVRNRVATA